LRQASHVGSLWIATDSRHSQLMKAIKKRPGYTQQDIDSDAILLRAYGKGTDVLIDRERMSTPYATIATPN